MKTDHKEEEEKVSTGQAVMNFSQGLYPWSSLKVTPQWKRVSYGEVQGLLEASGHHFT
jgi:hypothetical protein